MINGFSLQSFDFGYRFSVLSQNCIKVENVMMQVMSLFNLTTNTGHLEHTQVKEV